jgi:hypothetical protein
MTNTWFELSRAKVGDRVTIVNGWDIYPIIFIEPGSTGTIVENGLNEIYAELIVRPDDEEIRKALAEWDGNIILGPDSDPSIRADENKWQQPAPIALVH